MAGRKTVKTDRKKAMQQMQLGRSLGAQIPTSLRAGKADICKTENEAEDMCWDQIKMKRSKIEAN